MGLASRGAPRFAVNEPDSHPDSGPEGQPGSGGQPGPGGEPRPDLRALENAVAREAVRKALFGRTDPRRVGRYQIERRRGRGAMGAVFEAWDPSLQRRVALKLLEQRTRDPETLERLQSRVLHEARAMAKLQDPAVAAVYEVGRHGAWVFLAMELMTGGTCREWISRERPAWRRVLDVFIPLGGGLQAAHAAGLAHGDFKPDNLRFDAAGRLRILDFGLARSISTTIRRAAKRPAASSSSLLRSSGIEGFGGTPAYAAPERLDGAPPDERSDQFSFFVTLHECIFGQRPFAGATVDAVRAAIAGGPRIPVEGVPRALRAVLARGLSADPDARFATMALAVTALSRVRSRRSRRLVSGVASMVLAAGAGWMLAGGEALPCEDRKALADTVWAGRGASIEAARPDEPGVPAWSRLEPELHAYVEAWAEASHAACTLARTETDPGRGARELACLSQRRAAVERLLHRLERGGVSAWRSAPEAAADLPEIAACEDPKLHVPPPPAKMWDEVEALREALVVARVDADAGEHDTALHATEQVVRDARALGYAPLVAEALMAEGKLLADTDRVDDASSRLREAHVEAVTSGHLRVAADTAVALVYADGYGRARAELGHHWAWVAERLIDAAGDAGGLRASLVANEAAVWVAEGDAEAADAGFARALQLEQAKARPSPYTLDALEHNRGTVAVRADDPGRAREIFERTVARRRELYGDDHPMVARALSSLASAERELGMVDASLAHEREALARLEQVHGESSPALRLPLAGLAESEREAGHFEASIAAAQRLLQILAPHVSAGHPRLILAQQQIAIARLCQCRYDEAAALLQEQIVQVRDHHGPPDLLASLRHNLGEVRLRQGRAAEASELADLALAYWQGQSLPLQASHPRTALGMVALQQRRFEDAEPLLAEELQVRREKAGEGTILTAEARTAWGFAAWQIGRRAEGIEALRTGIAEYERRDRHGAHVPARMRATEWLAEVLAAERGEEARDEARRLRAEAHAFWTSCGDAAAATRTSPR